MSKKNSVKTADLQIETVPVESLTLDPANARKHDQRNLDAIVASLKRFGQQHPIIVNTDGIVVAGNGRVMAARSMGWETIRILRTDLTGIDATAFAIADNRTAELASWDDDALTQTLVALQNDEEYDHLVAGFSDDEIQSLVDDVIGTPEVVEDEVPEPPADPITQPGDLWIMGDHRLLCGDCTKVDDVDRLGSSFDLCMTDPPYGADIQYDTHDDSQDALVGLIKGFFPIAIDRCKTVALTPGINNLFAYPKPDWVLCWFYGAGTGRSPWGFTAWQPFPVWGKCPKLASGEGCHPDGFQWMMSRDDMDTNREISHACPKPPSVWARFMERLTNKKTKTVYEPFCGSGTTVVVCEKMGLSCYGIEISPAYCDVIVQRWENMTGQKAVRDG